MSLVEVLNELKRIRGKFLKDEGIYTFSKPSFYILPEYVTSSEPIETDVLDFTLFGGSKVIVFNNEEDVDVYVDVYGGVNPTARFYPVRTGIRIPAGDIKAGVLRDKHPYLKFRITSPSMPRKGVFQVLAIAWSN